MWNDIWLWRENDCVYESSMVTLSRTVTNKVYSKLSKSSCNCALRSPRWYRTKYTSCHLSMKRLLSIPDTIVHVDGKYRNHRSWRICVQQILFNDYKLLGLLKETTQKGLNSQKEAMKWRGCLTGCCDGVNLCSFHVAKVPNKSKLQLRQDSGPH